MSDHQDAKKADELPPKPEVPQNHNVKGGDEEMQKKITLTDDSGKKKA